MNINKANFFKKKENIFYYWCQPENLGKIQLSHEHNDFDFYDIDDLTKKEKFQKIAIQVMERLKND